MTWPSSVPSSSSFCLITHYFIYYSLESDCFRGQREKQYIENINLPLLIFTSFAAVFHYKIPFHINQCPWVGHINESGNIYSCLSIYTQTSVLCLWATVKKNVVGHRGKIKKCTHTTVQHHAQNNYTHNLYSSSLFLALVPSSQRIFSSSVPSMARNGNWKRNGQGGGK